MEQLASQMKLLTCRISRQALNFEKISDWNCMMDNNKIYALYGVWMKLFGFERSISSFVEKLEISCSNEADILDVGCGTGVVGLSLAKNIPKSKLLLTDLNSSLLIQAISNAQKAGIFNARITTGISDISMPRKIKLADDSEICLQENKFDVVSVGAAIGYSKDQENTIIELLSLVKKGGYFLNIEMNDGYIGSLVSSRYKYPIIPIHKMQRIITSQGFSLIDVPLSINYFPANFTRKCMLAKKL